MFLPRTYVVGKNELIDLMYDHAFAEIATDSSPADLAAEARHSFNATGVGENEWWHERSAELEEVCPDFSEHFPTLVLMESQGVFVNEDQSGRPSSSVWRRCSTASSVASFPRQSVELGLDREGQAHRVYGSLRSRR